MTPLLVTLSTPTSYLILTFLPHAQREHGVEIRAADGQQGSVGDDSPVVGHQHHVAQLAVLPLLVEAVQQLVSLIAPAEHLATQNHSAMTSGALLVLC